METENLAVRAKAGDADAVQETVLIDFPKQEAEEELEGGGSQPRGWSRRILWA